MMKLSKYLKNYRKQLVIGPTFKLIEAIFELFIPLVMASIVDVGVKNRDISYVLKMGGLMIGLGIVGLGCALVCQYLASVASQGFGTVVRNEMFQHINKLSHAEIDRFGTPSLVTRLTNDINQLQLGVAMLIRIAVRAPFLGIGALVMAMVIDIKLSVIFLIVLPIIVAILYFVMSRSVPLYRVIQKKLDRVSLITRENLEGVRVIRSLAKEDAEIERFQESSSDLAKTSIGVGKFSTILNPLTYSIINLAIVAILWFGGGRVLEGSLSQGEIIAFTNYMTQLSLALFVIADLVVIFTKSAASASRVIEVLDTKTTVIDTSRKEVLIDRNERVPKIEFKDVSFAYPGTSEYSIEHISFKIYKGETIGIIGGTGSGKTTLINLIPRFYNVSQGEILVDGHKVDEYPLSQLRKQIGIVPQKSVLFSGTLLENMKWRDKNATVQDVKLALEIAQATEFVDKLPAGLDSNVNQGGRNFSGGQRQRLTIARALVGNPGILILDDSSSALDYLTDASLRKAIKENTTDMTVLIVSQRSNSIKNADQIIVLDDGKAVGIGTHEKLLDTCEIYKEICLSQYGGEESL